MLTKESAVVFGVWLMIVSRDIESLWWRHPVLGAGVFMLTFALHRISAAK